MHAPPLQIAQNLSPTIKILVLGDSLLLNQYASLKCLMSSRPDLFSGYQVDYIRDNFLVKCMQGQEFRAGIAKAQRDIHLEEPSPFLTQVCNAAAICISNLPHMRGSVIWVSMRLPVSVAVQGV